MAGWSVFDGWRLAWPAKAWLRRRARFSAPQQLSFFSVATCEPGRRVRMALANLAANLGCLISTLPASRKRTGPVLPASFLAQAQASLARVSGGAFEDVAGDFVAPGPGGEHLLGQAGDLGLVGLGDPVDELVGGVEL